MGVVQSFGGDVRWGGGGQVMEYIVDNGSGGTGVARGGDSLWMLPLWCSRSGWVGWDVWGGERQSYQCVLHDFGWECVVGGRALD